MGSRAAWCYGITFVIGFVYAAATYPSYGLADWAVRGFSTALVLGTVALAAVWLIGKLRGRPATS